MSLYATAFSRPTEEPASADVLGLVVARCGRGYYHLAEKRSATAVCGASVGTATADSIQTWYAGRDSALYCVHCGRDPRGIKAIVRMLEFREVSRQFAA